MTTGSLCLTEILKSWKSCSSKSEASHTADSTSASGVALPCFSRSRLSSDPALTPIRIEVDVGDHRDLAVLRDLRQRLGVVLARAGDPNDVTAGGGELRDLLQGRV